MKNLFLLSVYFLLVSCTPKVVNFVNQESSFSRYNTFSITNTKLNNKNGSTDVDGIFDVITRNIETQMVRRNYKRKSIGADLTIRYEIITNRKTEINQLQTYPNSSFASPITYRTFVEGVLLLEMIDMTSRKIVWQASMDLSKYEREKDKNKIIKQAISSIFDTYLYAAGSSNIDETLKENK